jgi:hypothetical protein
MPYVVECLHTKCEALGLNPSTAKKISKCNFTKHTSEMIKFSKLDSKINQIYGVFKRYP